MKRQSMVEVIWESTVECFGKEMQKLLGQTNKLLKRWKYKVFNKCFRVTNSTTHMSHLRPPPGYPPAVPARKMPSHNTEVTVSCSLHPSLFPSMEM